MSSQPGNIEVMEELRAETGVRTFRAVDAEHNSPVIVKVFESPMLGRTKTRGTIRTRLKRWRDLRQPAILRPLHVESERDKLLLVLPLIPTGSLEDRLVMGAVSSLDLGDLSSGVSRAVQALHEAGMAHGNLKPTNLLFDEDGGVVLTDLDLGLHGSRREQMGGTTSSYRAPERVEGGKPTPEADQYSWALILLSMVTRRGPREALQELADIEDNPPSGGFRRQDGHTLSRRVAKPFRRALSHDPAERFGSISKFNQALQVAWGYTEAAAASPAPARRPGPQAATPTSKRRGSRVRLVALLVIPLLCILGAVPAISSGWAGSLLHEVRALSSGYDLWADAETTPISDTQVASQGGILPAEWTETPQDTEAVTGPAVTEQTQVPTEDGTDETDGSSDTQQASEPTPESTQAAFPRPEATETTSATPSPTPTPTESTDQDVNPSSCQSDPNHPRYCTPTPGS